MLVWRALLHSALLPDHAENWEGDERRKLLFSESGGSLNGPHLPTDLPFL